MGRPPCCDKDGIKKGPWTPEEDIVLASYIQEQGPGNWKSVPTNTGLLRCSKSCRLRWTNYLRPGIKRGNFNTHEERMIVHLQALLGNKWASIASYLPQRTDNDIKNYWNTHLKKKIKKFQSALEPKSALLDSTTCHQLVNKRYTDKRVLEMDYQPSLLRLNHTSTYASSTENISRLLEGWMKSSPKATITLKNTQQKDLESNNNNNSCSSSSNSNSNVVGTTSQQCKQANKEEAISCDDLISREEFASLLSFDNIINIAWEKLSYESTHHGPHQTTPTLETPHSMLDQPPFSFFERWLLDEATATGQVELMEFS